MLHLPLSAKTLDQCSHTSINNEWELRVLWNRILCSCLFTCMYYRMRRKWNLVSSRLVSFQCEGPVNKKFYFPDFREKWNKLQVRNWVDGVCEKFEVEEADVSELKTLNGKGLNKLSKEDWIRRSPKQGDLFYKMWMDLKKEKSSGEPDSSEPSGMLEFF